MFYTKVHTMQGLKTAEVISPKMGNMNAIRGSRTQ